MTDPQHRIQYYLAMERNNDAIQVLKNDSSPALLNKFVKTLKETHKAEMIELYLSECSYYLKTHFGPKSREYLAKIYAHLDSCLLYTSPSPRDRTRSRMPSSA